MPKTKVGELFVASISGGADFQATQSISSNATWCLVDAFVRSVLEQAFLLQISTTIPGGFFLRAMKKKSNVNLHPEAGEKRRKLGKSSHQYLSIGVFSHSGA